MRIDRIVIPYPVEPRHEHVLIAYLTDEIHLSGPQWAVLREAVNRLANAVVVVEGQPYTFQRFYDTFVDAVMADPYVATIWDLEDLEREAPVRQATYARQIVTGITQADGFDRTCSTHQLLLVYNLYWWNAFARGYRFEIGVFRDLSASGIRFLAHDPRRRKERRSAYDLVLLSLRGDVKHSTYFLSADALGRQPSAFFITRAYDATRHVWYRIVIVKAAVWPAFDGDTEETTPDALTAHLPLPARVAIDSFPVVIVDYGDWKQRVIVRQSA